MDLSVSIYIYIYICHGPARYSFLILTISTDFAAHASYRLHVYRQPNKKKVLQRFSKFLQEGPGSTATHAHCIGAPY